MDTPFPMEAETLDGYRFVRFLGRGGFGEVWLCRSEAMGDDRALKWISSNSPEHLEKEYDALLHYRKAAAVLRSPSLTAIEHVGRLDSGLYYVMPLADGTTDLEPSDPDWTPSSLTTRLTDQTKEPQWFSSREVIDLVLPILDGLQTLADAGLVHRDVKPDNILFFHGQPCLGDISLLGADSIELTVRGTPGYVTPSWFEGGHPDMFGVAATLYSLLTGNSPDKMGRSSFSWPPQGQDSLSADEQAEWKRLHGVIRRATEEEISERYVDFRAMADALSGKEKAPNPTNKSKSRRTVTTIMAALLILAGAAITVVYYKGTAKLSGLAENNAESSVTTSKSAFSKSTPDNLTENAPQNPSKAAELYKNALNFEAVGELEKQRETLELFVATGTQKVEPYFMLSLLLKDIEGREKAEQSYKKLIQKQTDNAALKTYLCYLIEAPNETTQHLLKVIESHPTFTPAYYEYLRRGPGMKALFPETTNGLVDLALEVAENTRTQPEFYDYQYYSSQKKLDPTPQDREKAFELLLEKEFKNQGLDPAKIYNRDYQDSVTGFRKRMLTSRKIAECRQKIKDQEASLYFYEETQKNAINELLKKYEAKLEGSLKAVQFRKTYAAYLDLFEKAPLKDFLYQRNNDLFLSDPRAYYDQVVGRALSMYEEESKNLNSDNAKAIENTKKELIELNDELKELQKTE